MKKLSEIDFGALHGKARKGFEDCIANNKETLGELDIAPESISTREDSIRITFFERDEERFILEAKILLVAPNHERIGWYCIHQDERGNVVDDYLVFE